VDIAAETGHDSFGGSFQTSDTIEQGGFTGARITDEGHGRSLSNVNGNAAQGLD
jgi:hypothetical protein